MAKLHWDQQQLLVADLSLDSTRILLIPAVINIMFVVLVKVSMNQKTILLALGLTLTITTALAIAPVNEMAYARSHRGNGGGTSGTSMGGAPSSMINHAKTMGNLTTSSMMSDVKTMGNLSSGSLN